MTAQTTIISPALGGVSPSYAPARDLVLVQSKDYDRAVAMPMTKAAFAEVFNGRFPMGGPIPAGTKVLMEAEGLDWLYVERVRNRLEGVSRGYAQLVAPSPAAERAANAMKAALFMSGAAA